jgi:Holliday junction resolvase-like predicted endonuclease
MIRHDGLVEKVKDELIEKGHTKIFDHVEYQTRRHYGEIDIYAINDKYILVFEIKGTDSLHNYTKAAKQLKRAEDFYFDKTRRIFKFYVSYDDKDRMQYKWVM